MSSERKSIAIINGKVVSRNGGGIPTMEISPRIRRQFEIKVATSAMDLITNPDNDDTKIVAPETLLPEEFRRDTELLEAVIGSKTANSEQMLLVVGRVLNSLWKIDRKAAPTDGLAIVKSLSKLKQRGIGLEDVKGMIKSRLTP